MSRDEPYWEEHFRQVGNTPIVVEVVVPVGADIEAGFGRLRLKANHSAEADALAEWLERAAADLRHAAKHKRDSGHEAVKATKREWPGSR